MELSSEDILRLNVLLANKPQAIRIDDSRMVVCGLNGESEARIKLNPVGRADTYLRGVRELLSGQVLGSPGGYPVYLKRWTRMGQMRDESLEQLLLLGEPEAVVAAVCAPGLTDELARRAWWAMPDAENARRMLGNPKVVAGRMGPVLAHYLIDYLPFETEPEQMIENVRLVLQPGLIDQPTVADLWKKARRKLAYYVGFLAATPDRLPEQLPARGMDSTVAEQLRQLAEAGSRCADLLLKVYSGPAQTYLHTVATVLGKPPTQEVVTTTFDLLADYFAALRPEGRPDQTIEELLAEADRYCADSKPEVRACLDRFPELAPDIRAMRLLSGLGYGALRPALRDSTAIGSLMRRKLEPVMQPVMELLETLRGRG
jgi:hypothetical protein